MTAPVWEVQQLGQSIWCDNLRRGMLTSGELAGMIGNDGVTGLTSNPTIFEKAIASGDYDPALKGWLRQGIEDAKQLYEHLAIEDIRLAADLLHGVYEKTDGGDGFVSLEVAPYWAKDTHRTIHEGLDLFRRVGRDNVMIKVPGTLEGLPAITALIAHGVPVNVTLLFDVEMYDKSARAFFAGLERFIAEGGDPRRVASVASFFVSRIDSEVDKRLARTGAGAALELLGQAALANARLAYDRFHALLETPVWRRLQQAGARPQRVLWASTSTKNPAYPKLMYVEPLIGPRTINTLPEETFRTFLSHGKPRSALTENFADQVQHARQLMDRLGALGIDLRDVTEFLMRDGIAKFEESFDQLLGVIEAKKQALLGAKFNGMTLHLGSYAPAVDRELDDWRRSGKLRWLWAKDAALWTNAKGKENEALWLGWLDADADYAKLAPQLSAAAQFVQTRKFRDIVLLGMGGSSLCPEVLRQTFGVISGFPRLHVLDSVNPAQIRAVAKQLELASTGVMVASKSGTTVEPNVLLDYFLAEFRAALGAAPNAGSHFIAITDPQSALEKYAREQGFTVILGTPTVGGRFSALSPFGLVPAAVMGLPVDSLMAGARRMMHGCGPFAPTGVNPGARLGIALGILANEKRDKLTIFSSPSLQSFGSWLEQLIAESTGKEQRVGIIPVNGEALGPPTVYGQDRAFVFLRLATDDNRALDAEIQALQDAGHPVIRIAVTDAHALGQEFFRWEIATAVAGAVLQVNPFDQPDVEAAKVATRELVKRFETTGQVAPETPLVDDGVLQLFADPANAAALQRSAGGQNLFGWLRAHLARLMPGDYFAINAYLAMGPALDAGLQQIRLAVRDAKQVATTVGYGPRFLHSTGQLQKGGPNRIVVLQLTADDDDLPIPNRQLTFGMLLRFQAQGDFQVLNDRQRRVLRVHLGRDPMRGLAQLVAAIKAAV